MKSFVSSFTFLLFHSFLSAQTNSYQISFENAVHHEAQIEAVFKNIDTDTLKVRMARSSPGRYAIHEFAKNIYAFSASDGNGKKLDFYRPNPYEWHITGHNGTVSIAYTLFANRGDGTYSQIDETHAHLNMPATFMYAPELSDREIEIDFKTREDLTWKVATQLPLVSGTKYTAPNLQYFMDSPTEISDFHLREFQVDGQAVQLALHHNGSEKETDTYFEKVKKTVLAEKEVFGELPKFDFGKYRFLACYIPNASGDGMEHRNSTILTSTRSLAEGGMEQNIGTVSHEFFHAWNVERIRPKDLEPFDFSKANMTGALWFAEGFTSYYTSLILCRAGLISPKKYIEGLTGTFNYVWNSPGRQFFNPTEMSYQAPFVDAATSVDPVNRNNTFISYYSYGSVLGLALDLSLRQKNLNLDDYMKLVWHTYGKKEIPYSIANLQETLNSYAGNGFGNNFFNKYVHKSGIPDYKMLFESVGVVLKQNTEEPYFGANVSLDGDGNGELKGNSKMGSPAYKAGLGSGDVIVSINGNPFPSEKQFAEFIKEHTVGDELKIEFLRFGIKKSTIVKLEADPSYSIFLLEKEGVKPSKKVLEKRKEWLKIK